jgi:hypothetical protein
MIWQLWRARIFTSSHYMTQQSTPGCTSKKGENICPPKACAQIFSAASFMTAPNANNPRPVMKCQCHEMTLSWKQNEALTTATTRRSFENIVLCERSQPPKATSYMILLIWNTQNPRTGESNPYKQSKLVIAMAGAGRGGEGWEMTAKRVCIFFAAWWKFSVIWWWLYNCEYAENRWCVHFKGVIFMI